jgi:hypothetical protein
MVHLLLIKMLTAPIRLDHDVNFMINTNRRGSRGSRGSRESGSAAEHLGYEEGQLQ